MALVTMTAKRRALTWTSVVLGLVVVSIGIAAAREWGPPKDMLAGIREEGAYTMRIPGTYGHLIPILPFPYTKDDPKKGGGNVAPLSVDPQAKSGGPVTIDGKKPAKPLPNPGLPMGGPKSMGDGSIGIGDLITPTGHEGGRADGLDASLREAIRRLHTR
jgi:hypothetical protein